MAARNPTDFTRWIDEEAVERKDPIVLTQPNNIFNDLQWLMDAPHLLFSWGGIELSATAGSATEVFRIRLHNKDLATSATTTTPVSWTARLRLFGGATGTITLNDGTTTDTTTSTSATAAWCAVQTGYVLQTNGVDVDLVVSLHISSGTGTVFLDGLLIYAEET